MKYNDRMTLLARVGFAARGLVYLLVGWFALDVALNGGQAKDNQGALGTLTQIPLGHVLLGICSLGFVGYAVWRLTEAAIDPEMRGDGVKGKLERAGYAMSGIAHLVLATATARFAMRQASAQSGSPGDQSAESWSAWILDQPDGVFALVLGGVTLFAVAAAQALKAYKGRFDELDGDVPAPGYVRWVGRIGFAARALIFADWLVRDHGGYYLRRGTSRGLRSGPPAGSSAGIGRVAAECGRAGPGTFRAFQPDRGEIPADKDDQAELPEIGSGSRPDCVRPPEEATPGQSWAAPAEAALLCYAKLCFSALTRSCPALTDWKACSTIERDDGSRSASCSAAWNFPLM